MASRLGVVYPTSLIGIRRRAVRLGLWWRVEPFKRALVDSVIMYVKRGGVVKSPSLLALIRQVAVEVLALIMARSLRLIAYIIGMRLVGRFNWLKAMANNPRSIMAIGLMWINTPNWYRAEIK